LDCVGTAGAGCELDAGFTAQQSIRAQQSAQLPITDFTQTADADTGAGAICIQTSNTLNKMADNCFTNSIQSRRSIGDCKSFFSVASNGHQNGHQTSQKEYEMVMMIRLDSPMKSGILALQARVRADNPDHWLHFQVRISGEIAWAEVNVHFKRKPKLVPI
jgi:hypothetical protein